MNTIFLSFIIVCLLVYSIYKDEMFRREREKLIKLIKADTLDEVTRNEVVTEVERKESIPPEYVSTEELDDEAYVKAITGKKE